VEKLTNEERNESEQAATQVDVSKMSSEQLQMGIDTVMHQMLQKFAGELKQLESVVGRQVNVAVNAKLGDGRKLHIRVR
jgi:hypothetical protein